MRCAHILFYAGKAGDAPSALIKRNRRRKATPAAHQRFSHQRTFRNFTKISS
jgi:hypothetical protein